MYQASVQGWQYVPSKLKERLSEGELEQKKQAARHRAEAVWQKLQEHTGQVLVYNREEESCLVDFLVERETPFQELIEYAASVDKVSLEKVYQGVHQSQFEHLLKIRNQLCYFVPRFFLFPARLILPGEAAPIYVASSIKLKYEIYELNKIFKLEAKPVQKMPDFFKGTREAMEDFNNRAKWIQFTFILLTKLAFKSQEKGLPIVFNPNAV